LKADRRFLLLIALVVSLLIVVVPGVASARTLHVPGDYKTIQGAVYAAAPGDTIEVGSGTYQEDVFVKQQVLLKGVDTGSGLPVIDMGREKLSVGLYISAAGATVQGFIISNATNGISVRANNCMVLENTVKNNDFGIIIDGSGCKVSGNSVTDNTCGIKDENSSNSVTGNLVGNNKDGIALDGSSHSIIKDNTVNNNSGDGILISNSGYATVTGNKISNNDNGINIYNSSNSVVAGNVVNSNKNGIRLNSPRICSNITLTGNSVNNNRLGGMDLAWLNDSVLSGNMVSNNTFGIFLLRSYRCSLKDNFALNNTVTGVSEEEQYGLGIYLYNATRALLTGNTANNNNEGIHLASTADCILTENTAANNFQSGLGKGGVGIDLDHSTNISVRGNVVSNNTDTGINGINGLSVDDDTTVTQITATPPAVTPTAPASGTVPADQPDISTVPSTRPTAPDTGAATTPRPAPSVGIESLLAVLTCVMLLAYLKKNN